MAINNLKQHMHIWSMLMLMLLGGTACSGSDDDSKEQGGGNTETTENITITPQTLSYPNNGGTAEFTVQAPNAAQVKTEASWLTLTKSKQEAISLDGGKRRAVKIVFTAKAAANLNNAERQTTINVTVNNKPAGVISVSQAAGSAPVSDISAKAIAKKIFAGINIGNTMECPGPNAEGVWSGAKVNEQYIKSLKAAGFSAVRIPCAWHSYMIDSRYTIDPAWLNRVHEVVGMCLANDLYVVLNSHWDTGWLENNVFDASKEAAITAEQKALWTQVAEKMKEYDSRLLFAACNEPGYNSSANQSWSDAKALARLVKYEQTMIDAVRATGGNNADRCLVIQGPSTDISNTYDYMNTLPVDKVADRMLVEIHFYDPYQFCLMEQDADWGNTFWYWGEGNYVSGSKHNADWGDEKHIKDQFAKMKRKFVDKGYPVILGEYSAMFRTVSENQAMHDKSVAYYGEVVTREAKKAGCVPFYWETGGVFNRNNGQIIRQDVVDGLIKGATEGQYPY